MAVDQESSDTTDSPAGPSGAVHSGPVPVRKGTTFETLAVCGFIFGLFAIVAAIFAVGLAARAASDASGSGGGGSAGGGVSISLADAPGGTIFRRVPELRPSPESLRLAPAMVKPSS